MWTLVYQYRQLRITAFVLIILLLIGYVSIDGDTAFSLVVGYATTIVGYIIFAMVVAVSLCFICIAHKELEKKQLQRYLIVFAIFTLLGSNLLYDTAKRTVIEPMQISSSFDTENGTYKKLGVIAKYRERFHQRVVHDVARRYCKDGWELAESLSMDGHPVILNGSAKSMTNQLDKLYRVTTCRKR